MDTWASIQENKRNQDNLRERIKRRRKERQDILSKTVTSHGESSAGSTSVSTSLKEGNVDDNNKNSETTEGTSALELDKKIENFLQQYLSRPSLLLPVSLSEITFELNKILIKNGFKKTVTSSEIEVLLQKQAVQKFLTLKGHDNDLSVQTVDRNKLAVLIKNCPMVNKPSKESLSDLHLSAEVKTGKRKHNVLEKKDSNRHKTSESKIKSSKSGEDDIEALLSIKTAKEEGSTKISDEIQELLNTSSTKEIILAKNFRSMGGSQVKEFCAYGTREECVRRRGHSHRCRKVHFKKILKPHTDEALGDCSFLNTCFHMDTCKYVHYEIDYRGTDFDPKNSRKPKLKLISSKSDLLEDSVYISRKMIPPQWINCDVRYIDMSILGKFSVIMADPPWDIHMELPYGTMADEEMRALRIQDLSDDGIMFLWVTVRAMELGRELFDHWGYKRCDELIWVKTNQLQRLIRTGRTGHWLNHGKEHCLVGIKGNPKGINRGLDCDVLVAEVRDTSHKPDEIYGIIERLSPGTRKLEIFGRMPNVQPNWITLGNQLDGVHLSEPECVESFKLKYPDGKVTNPKAK